MALEGLLSALEPLFIYIKKLKQDHNSVVITTLLLLIRSVHYAILSSFEEKY